MPMSQSSIWAEMGRVPICLTTHGKELMVNNFLTKHCCMLKLTYEETDPSIYLYAREILKFGSGGDGYWNNDQIFKQVKEL